MEKLIEFHKSNRVVRVNFRYKLTLVEIQLNLEFLFTNPMSEISH